MKLVGKRSDTDVGEVDRIGEFDRRMQEQIQKGHRPHVEVVIQVRHDVPSVDAYRAKLARVVRGMRARGVPDDERPEIIEQAMTNGDSREWTDVEVYWDGRYRRGDVKLPVREELEAIEDAYGAAEARVRVRARI